jgi:hypothetical protein
MAPTLVVAVLAAVARTKSAIENLTTMLEARQ